MLANIKTKPRFLQKSRGFVFIGRQDIQWPDWGCVKGGGSSLSSLAQQFDFKPRFGFAGFAQAFVASAYDRCHPALGQAELVG